MAVPGEQTGQWWMVVVVVELGGRGGSSLETGEKLLFVWDGEDEE